jgi:glutamate-1-semialdehyde 2,1-aminomutase
MLITQNSDELYERACRVIPAGLMSNLKRAAGFQPFYKTHGIGARLYDVDGNEHIDFSLSYGSAILGHSNASLRYALKQQADRLYDYHSSALQIEAAERVIACIPSAQMVRFACSGVEANRAALRVARGFTGRNQYVRFNGHYHGQMDHLMGGLVYDQQNPVPVEGVRDGDPFSQWMHTEGRNRDDYKQVYLIEWNDLHAVETLFANHGDDIAAVLMETVMLNHAGCMPEAGYLEGVRELCTKYGVVLIFDEVLTGFRIGLHGAQGHFGVTPDMTTLGKALGGGMPVSSFCGRSDLMELVASGRVIEAGTFNGHPMSMAAVIATLDVLSHDDGAVYQEINWLGDLLRDGMLEIAHRHNHQILLQGFPACYTLLFNSKPKVINHAGSLDSNFHLGSRFMSLMLERGIEFYGRFCISTAHTRQDITDMLDRADDAFSHLMD